MITTFEVLATVFGILQGLFVMLNKRCNWIFYVLQMASMIVFSYMSHLYGDVVNSSIYLVIGFIGFITWGREGGSKIERASSEEIGIWIAVLCFGSLFGSMLLAQTDDPLPRLDAFTTVSSFVATILMVRHKIETLFLNDTGTEVCSGTLKTTTWYTTEYEFTCDDGRVLKNLTNFTLK